jgi:hypothetical protein
MAIAATQIAVGTSAAPLVTGSDEHGSVLPTTVNLYNEGPSDVRLGPSSVTAAVGTAPANGLLLKSGSGTSIALLPGDALYAICGAAGSAVVSLLGSHV